MNERSKKELDKLLNGNRNFVNGTPTTKNMTLETLKKYAFHQEQYACILSCSDSRVVPEIIFDCGIGELFVIRVAGLVTDPHIIESVDYAVKKLNVPLLIILGHDDCGVMKYANEHYPKLMNNFHHILESVYPVLDGTPFQPCDAHLAKMHTEYIEKQLLSHSEIIKKAVEKEELYIAKCHFHHDTGLVSLI